MFPYKFQVQMVSHVHSIDLFEQQEIAIVVRPMGEHVNIEIQWQQMNSFVLVYVLQQLDLANNFVEVWHDQSCQLDSYFLLHQKQTMVKHHVNQHLLNYSNCRLKMYRWTTRTKQQQRWMYENIFSNHMCLYIYIYEITRQHAWFSWD